MASPAVNVECNPNVNNHENETIIVVEQSVIHRGIELSSRSLFGRILSDRAFTGGTIESALNIIWRQPNGFKVRDKENSIVKAKVNLNATKSLRRSLKVAGPNQNVIEVTLKVRSKKRSGAIGSNLIKPIPVNLIQSLANLSVQPQQKDIVGEENEVTSRICQPITNLNCNITRGSVAANDIPREILQKRNETDPPFAFAAIEGNAHHSPKKGNLKQARRKFIRISGTKRRTQGDNTDSASKKICSEDTISTEEGDGVTPQWAPKCQ
ncbi:hypothetical protein PIB30_032385 [Stylosanthes scabra]|uniref:Uncharacterized protein n=1 Tax=Stylosanthes scabra TaxID=79078 RepID=A0ABU6VB12_9FABA|nr:hypothetical protein [Stylosanthes scabra]